MLRNSYKWLEQQHSSNSWFFRIFSLLRKPCISILNKMLGFSHLHMIKVLDKS